MQATVTIGPETRSGDELSPWWITDLLQEQRKNGETVCIRVHLKGQDVDFTLSTGCPSRGGGHSFTAREEELIKLWNGLVGEDDALPPGKLVAFLSRIGVSF